MIEFGSVLIVLIIFVVFTIFKGVRMQFLIL